MLRSQAIFTLFSTTIIGIVLAGSPSISKAGCGCSFMENSAKNTHGSSEYCLFWSNLDYTKAKINMGGKYVNLKLVSSKESKKEIKGAKSIQIYKAMTENIKVRVEKIVTHVCGKNDTECEVISYDAIITVNNENQIRKFKTSGGCGC